MVGKFFEGVAYAVIIYCIFKVSIFMFGTLLIVWVLVAEMHPELSIEIKYMLTRILVYIGISGTCYCIYKLNQELQERRKTNEYKCNDG